MGLRAGLDWCGKSRPPPGFDPRTVQPVGSRYSDYLNYIDIGIANIGISKYFCIMLILCLVQSGLSVHYKFHLLVIC